MLSIASYDRTYVELSRAKIDAQVDAFRALKAEAGQAKALPAFETSFFVGLVMVLDHYFDHRARGQEGKDGNPLNEVRMICNSLMQGDGKLLNDKQIRLDPKTSVLGLKIGDEIAVDAAGFARLLDGFFVEIGKRYP